MWEDIKSADVSLSIETVWKEQYTQSPWKPYDWPRDHKTKPPYNVLNHL